MKDMYEEEFRSEVRTYIVWCEGRLEELRRRGLVRGQSSLSEEGWTKYCELVASGFVPAEEKVIQTLEADLHVPAELVKKMALLMLRVG